MFLLISPILSFVFGSIAFGAILTKIFGYGNIREIGSGNIGTTNVLRTGNKMLALLTLILDGGKGAFLILIFIGIPNYTDPSNIFSVTNYPDNIMFSLALILGFFAILGHCFSGGKGVATALGVFLVATPYAGLAACATWLITAKITKISSLSALIAVAIAPIVTLIIYGTAPAVICVLITVLIWIRHKDNIKRLLKGEEPKIGAGKKDKEEAKVEPVSE